MEMAVHGDQPPSLLSSAECSAFGLELYPALGPVLGPELEHSIQHFPNRRSRLWADLAFPTI